MTMPKSLTDDEQLLRAIGRAIKRSRCPDVAVVESLMSIAAGIAADRGTHDCRDFHQLAHNMHHDAVNVLAARNEDVGYGVGGYEN
jgi:hypothetical protein